MGDDRADREPPVSERTFPLIKSEENGEPSERSIVIVGSHGVTECALPDRAVLVVGRDPTADVHVDDPFVSKRHALLLVTGGVMTLVDEGSSNGTFLNGVRVAARDPHDVRPSDIIHLGSSSLLFRVAQPSAPRPHRKRLVAAPAMLRLYDLLETIAPSRVTVLLLGETGVGKEVLATALHESSPRAGAPFVRVNCAAMSPSLVEAELFGYERGAFTGALAAKQGLLEAADRGTLFLDEIGDAPLELQAKLLRFIESGELLRVGAVHARTVDVRVVAATNRDLPAMMSRGEFRTDLYFRLNGITFHIPPLRARREEILLLAEAVAHEIGARTKGWSSVTLTSRAKQKLLAHEWPGNVRELRACIERAVLLSRTPTLDDALLVLESVMLTPSSPTVHDVRPPMKTLEAPVVTQRLPAATVRPPEQARAENDSAVCSSEAPSEAPDAERAAVLAALAQTAGNQSRAAELLGISRRTLLKRLDAYDVPRPRKR